MDEVDLRTMLLHNVAILVAITVCTATVAVFARSAGGLGSLLLTLFIMYPSDKSDKP